MKGGSTICLFLDLFEKTCFFVTALEGDVFFPLKSKSREEDGSKSREEDADSKQCFQEPSGSFFIEKDQTKTKYVHRQ